MKPKFSLKLSIALFNVSFFWGTTYLAIRIAVQTIPAVYVASFRHLMAGFLILFYLLISKKLTFIGWDRVKHNCILSFLMLVLANGLTTFGEKFVPSGLTALITTLSPLLVLTLNLSLRKELLTLKIVLGVLLGLTGMILIFFNNISQLFDPQYRIGIFAILTAVICWSIGTVYSKYNKSKEDHIIIDLCIQLLFAGFFLFIFGLSTGIKFNYQLWDIRHFGAIVYLMLFGSIVGYFSYLYALSKMPSTSVSVFTYFNVIVALFLGWLILDEQVSWKLILATCFILAGVILANCRKKEVIV